MNAIRGLLRRSTVARRCMTNQTSRCGVTTKSIFSGRVGHPKNTKKYSLPLISIAKPVSIQTEGKNSASPNQEENVDNIEMLRVLGNELIAQTRYQEAIEVFERIFAQHKKLSPDALHEVFMILCNLYPREEDISPLMLKLIEIREGKSITDMASQALEYAREKQYDKEYIYNCQMAKALADHVRTPQFTAFYANIENKHEKVIDIIENAPESELTPHVLNFLALAQLNLGKPEEALKSIDKALELSLDESWTELRRPFVNTKVQVLIRLGKLEEAIDATEDQDTNYFNYRSLGQIAYASGEFDDALTCYNESISVQEQMSIIDVNRYQSYLLKATALDAKGDLHDAIKAYEYVLWIKPDEQVSMERLAALYLDIDQIYKAKEMLEKLIELRPTDQKLLSKMEYVKARENRANKQSE